MTPDIVRVSATSTPTAVAGSIAGIVRENGYAQVQAIGAGAVNQAIKAIAVARSFVEQDGLDLAAIPTFVQVDINGEDRTAIRFHIESRATEDAPDFPRGDSRPVAA